MYIHIIYAPHLHIFSALGSFEADPAYQRVAIVLFMAFGCVVIELRYSYPYPCEAGQEGRESEATCEAYGTCNSIFIAITLTNTITMITINCRYYYYYYR